VLGLNTLEVIANAELPISGSAVAAIAHGNKCYLAKVDAQGRLLERARAVHKDALVEVVSEDEVLITTKACASLLPFTQIKIVDLDATAVMCLAKKIIHESRTNLYNQVSPIYVSEPSITVPN
jgi:tRNA A37 threonylcarbamoyladenosine modification protein TsaB